MPEALSLTDRTPASPAQQGVWLTERLGLAREAFHMPVRISFQRIDTAALAHAVDALTHRHPALAARVVERDGGVWQEPAAVRPTLVVLEAAADEADVEKQLAEQAALPFALETGPLSRFTLYRRPDASAELLITAHHVVFDGNSKDVLVHDLAQAYELLAQAYELAPLPPNGAPVASPAPPDLVRRAADRYGPRWATATEPVLPGAPRLSTTAQGGETTEWRLDVIETAALAAASDACGTTVFEFLLAALHGLLRRYGGEAVPVSVPLSTRTPELAREIGLFVNELPVFPPVCDASQTFADFAGAVRAELRALYPYRTVPFGTAVPGLSPRVGLAPVSLGYRRRGTGPQFADTGARIDWTVHNRTARNTLHLQIVEAPPSPYASGTPGGGLDFSLQYDPAALAPDVARRIAGHFRALLAGAVAAPDARLVDLPLLDATELRAVTTAPNATERPYPADRTVVDLVRDQARATPEALAVSASGKDLRYRELLARVDQLAAALRAEGVRPGDLVALHLDRTADLPPALLAVLAIGASYLPLDPGYPDERLALVLGDSHAVLLLADREPAPSVAAAAPAVLRLPAPIGQGQEGQAGPAGQTEAASGSDVARPDHVAYVLYTSGSTGRPKGVAVGHRGLVNLLTSFADLLGSGPQHTWLGLTSLSFDISALELFLPLVTGGRLVLAPDGLAVDGPGLLALIGAQGVTHVQATPSGWRVMLAAGASANALSGVTGLVGGEALPLALAHELGRCTARLFNVYGPTETTVWSTCAELPAGRADSTQDSTQAEQVGIGHPIANTQVYVVDEQLTPTPIGVPGELVIGGDGVAHGYLGRPELTTGRFVPNPFGAPDTRLYRTGDRGVRAADGSLRFLGRMDDQVKIRGHRIELGEIESALLEHPDLAQAAVALWTDDDGEPFLAGYTVPAAGARPPAPAALRAHLLRTLPAAMTPQRWLTLERLPLTPNRKLDRRALPLPLPPHDNETALPPAADDGDETTATVRRIWAEVLRLPEVGPEDDLFDLGGHSLTVIQIAARIRDALGVELDFDVFFDVPTPAAIAALVRERP
ncbi:amino acid adenylation domain-containing protein [Streptomyces sp. NBC_00237]|uniref:non-ribosomal peptide synthetase n=1 Tax=Streptomyces sp. NBC_00237 TaxID=2975687 RepID=UPI002258AEA3|nr:amino acid adenylation domain-containing protein [Streptomyces sp. NBC_00237]MCX5205527.1 amino acid adenylation domain-containing protein [Streptomyces sp. NBC_00237]